MGRTARAVLKPVLALALLALGPRALGFEADCGGVHMELPDGWWPLTAGAPRPAPRTDCATERAQAAEGWVADVWVRGEGEANLNVLSREGHTEVHPGRLAAARHEFASVLAASGLGLTDVRIVDLCGRPAYRLDVSGPTGDRSARQVSFVLSGTRTFLLTFTADGDAPEALLEEFETIARTASIGSRGGLLDDMPAWLCGSALGLLAGLAAATRRLRSSGSGPQHGG